MSTKVSPFMGGLGRDVTNKFEITDNATVVIGTEGSTGNLELGHDLVVGNSIVASGNVTVGSHSDNLVSVTGSITSSVDITATRDLITSNTLHATKDVLTAGNMTVGSHSDNTLAVTGSVTSTVDITATRDLITSNTHHVTEDIFVGGDVTIGSHSDNTFTVTGVFDCGALS